MITWEEAFENPELMIKYKDKFKNVEIFSYPWYEVFRQYPYLYREFSDRFDELGWLDIACALRDDFTLVLDLKKYLHKMSEEYIGLVVDYRPEMSLCMKYREYPDKVEAAYYITFPHEVNNLNNEEKREILKKTMELLKEENK